MEKRKSNIGVQLDLFADILLTPEQQTQVNRYIENQNKNITFQENENQRIERMLIEAGFIKGVHFKNDFKSFIDTRTVTLGYSYNQTQFEVEVTAKFLNGGIALLGKRFDLNDKKLKNGVFSFDVQRDKIQSWSIQEQSRYVKPKTLLTKLLEHNEKEKRRFEEYNKRTALLNVTLEKYTTLYPSATVTSGREYSRYDGSFEVVEIKFKSGSYIKFALDIHNNKETLYHKYDAEFNKMSSEELLERFSKQEALK